MRQLLLIFIVLLYSNESSTQEKFKSQVEQLNYYQLDSISRVYVYKDSVKSNIVHQKILKLLDEKKIEEKQIPSAYTNLFYWHYSRSNFNKAISYSKLAFKAAKQSNLPRFECLSLITTGLTYYEIGNYNLAIDYNFKALEIAKKNNIAKLEYAAIANIGKFKLAYGDYKGSIDIYENCLNNLNKEQSDDFGDFFPEMYNDLTQAYLKTKNLEKAEYYNKLGINSSKTYKYYLKVHIKNKAEIEVKKKNYDAALEILDTIKDIKELNFDNFNVKANFHLTKGEIYFLKGNYKKALKEFKLLESLENKKRIHHLNFQEGFSYIAKTYSKLGNNKLALKYYKKALETFTESEKKKVNLISDLTDKYDKNQIDQILNNKKLSSTEFIHRKHSLIEKEIQKLNSEKEEKNRFLYILLFCFSLIIGVSIFYFQKVKNKNKQKLKILLAKISENENSNPTPKPLKIDSTLKLKDSEIERIIKNLDDLKKDKFYLKTNCTASKIAKELKTNTTYLSKIINSNYQKSFSQYINELRINYVLERLKNDPLFRRYSIQSLANEIGFKSRESFNNAFKKHTGILPSYFIKELNQNFKN